MALLNDCLRKGKNLPTPLGIKIRSLRKARKLSLDQLAALAEISKSYLWELENRDAANPTMDKLTTIAEQLGVTTEFLFDSQETSPSDAVADHAFFRKYQKLPPETKEKIRGILELIQGSDDKSK